MLKYSDSLTHVAMCMRSSNNNWAQYYRVKNPQLEVTSRIGIKKFENNMERAAKIALEQIRNVGRYLGYTHLNNKKTTTLIVTWPTNSRYLGLRSLTRLKRGVHRVTRSWMGPTTWAHTCEPFVLAG